MSQYGNNLAKGKRKATTVNKTGGDASTLKKGRKSKEFIAASPEQPLKSNDSLEGKTIVKVDSTRQLRKRSNGEGSASKIVPTEQDAQEDSEQVDQPKNRNRSRSRSASVLRGKKRLRISGTKGVATAVTIDGSDQGNISHVDKDNDGVNLSIDTKEDDFAESGSDAEEMEGQNS